MSLPPPPTRSGGPSVAMEDEEHRHRYVTESQLRQRDQAFLRLQRDYEELASRAKEIARELERKMADAEDAVHGRSEAQQEVARLTEARSHAEAHAAQLQERLDAAVAAQTEATSQADALQHELEIARAQRRQWENTARTAQDAADEAKRRAAAALTEKDRQIETITAQLNSARSLAAQDAANDPERSTVNAATEQRLAAAEAKVSDLTSQLAKARVDLDEQRASAEAARRESASAKRAAEDAAERAKVAQAMYDGEAAAHSSSRKRLEAAVKDAEDEARSLQKQLNAAARSAGAGGGSSSSSADSGAEWERRAKELAELVVEKQAALEARRSEVEQWKSRCESAQQRVREMELVSLSVSTGVGHRAVGMPGGRGGGNSSAHNDDGGRDHAEGMLGEFGRSQFFGNLSRRGKVGLHITNTARHIDGLALHAGRALQRSSVLRVAVIIYVIVLQLWAFFAVALTSVPEQPALQQPH